MNEEKKLENKKEDRKSLKLFIPILLVACLVGFLSGGFIYYLRDNGAGTIAEYFANIFKIITPYANIVMNGISIVVCVIIYSIARKQMKAFDGENEEQYKKIDSKLSVILIISNITFILSYFFMAAGFEYVLGVAGGVKVALYMGGFLLAMAGNIILQQVTINGYKLLNPEKKGSVYSFDFNKQWTKSCDEAELHNIYKAAYGSYKVTNVTFLVLWIVCIFGNIIWHFGLVPVTIVIILWLVQFISYMAYAAYYEKNPEK